MKNYPLYNVKKVNSFLEFVNDIKNNFKNDIAFESKQTKYSYNDFTEMIFKCAGYFNKYQRNFFVVDINNPMIFAVIYMAVVISDNIAILSSREDMEEIGFDKEYIYINDENALQIIDKEPERFLTDTNKDELCTIVCSSGTTSVKKGVMLSQNNLLTDMVGGMQCYEYKRYAKYVNILPYTHLFGIVADLMGPLYSGGTICFSDNKLQFFDNLKYFMPTNLNLPPALVNSMYAVLKKTGSFEAATGGKLKKVMCAGAKMDDSVNIEFEKYGLRVYSAYGLTECSPCISMSRDEFYKDGSAGVILPCCNAKIIDDELVVSGPTVMLGYYEDDKSTQKVIRDGWLYTGDLGYIDEDNFLFLIGRKSSIIVFDDGFKLLPERYEEKINGIDCVEESLIKGIEINGRVKLDICAVVSDMNYIDEAKKCISKIVKEEKMQQYINNVKISIDRLQRNKLGKIIRNQ